MELVALKNRVGSLEEVLSDYLINSERENSIMRQEMKEFREEMAAARKHSDRKMDRFENEMSDFKNEMSDFKNEMSDFKIKITGWCEKLDRQTEEGIRERRDFNKRMGEQSNRLGTFAEDFAAPNLPRIAQEYFDEKEIWSHTIRTSKVNPDNLKEQFEFDAITVTENLVLLLEVKFTPRNSYIEEMTDTIKNFRQCFPEYTHKKLIPVFASWSISKTHLQMLTKMGIYAMAMGEDTMELFNFDEVGK
jgi:hypothetical protein